MEKSTKEYLDQLNHIKNLFLLGKSDGNLDEQEIEIISQIARHHQLSYQDIQFIFNEQIEIPFTLPAKEVDRLAMLYDSVLLIVSDLKIHENERKICIDLAKKFEFNPQIVDALIEDVLGYVVEGKNCQEAIVYLTKYLHPRESLN